MELWNILSYISKFTELVLELEPSAGIKRVSQGLPLFLKKNRACPSGLVFQRLLDEGAEGTPTAHIVVPVC